VPITAWELSLADPTGVRGPRTGVWQMLAGSSADGASPSASATVVVV
jgi:hypothetical protein